MYLALFFVVLVILLLFTSALLYLKATCGYCKCSKHLIGKTVIVTGGNAGIGFMTAKDMAERGARVILACRNESRGIAARDSIAKLTGNADVHFRQLDLTSFSSVRSFASDIIKHEKRLDILINNAGMVGTEYKFTDDNLLIEMQCNHFGPFLLTCLLLPLLKSSAPSRILNVSSAGHKYAFKFDVENLNLSKDTYNSGYAYTNSKLCNILMSLELARRLKGTNVTANSLHPGAVNTNLLTYIWPINYILPLFNLMTKTPWEGAQTSIYLAVSPEVEGVSGYYYADCHQERPSSSAQNEDLARRLWELSEKVVKLNDDNIS